MELTYLLTLLNIKNKPLYIIDFITEACNFSCSHCLLQEFSTKTKPIDIDTKETIIKGIGKLLYVSITGGEPFSHKNIDSIISLYAKHCKPKILLIPSNGYFTEKIISVIENTVPNYPNTNFEIIISLNGLEKTHNKICENNNSFKNAITTYKKLINLSKKINNLNVGFNLTVSQKNYNEMSELYRYLEKNVELHTVTTCIERHKNSFPDKQVTCKWIQLNNIINKNLYQQKQFRHLPFGTLINTARKYRNALTIDTILKNKRIKQCLAGKRAAVINQTKVFACEDNNFYIDDLKNYNLNFKNLIKKNYHKYNNFNCICTHECFYNINILFNLKIMIKLFFKAYL